MPEFFQLSAAERLDALDAVADASGLLPHLLEKDIWVVWALRHLFSGPYAEHLVFKGGTSLSKAYGVIRRFSEDVDLTYDIRVSRRTLWAPMAKHCRRRAARRNGGRAKSAGVCRSGSPGPRSP